MPVLRSKRSMLTMAMSVSVPMSTLTATPQRLLSRVPESLQGTQRKHVLRTVVGTRHRSLSMAKSIYIELAVSATDSGAATKPPLTTLRLWVEPPVHRQARTANVARSGRGFGVEKATEK